jgi:pimeloyl-ACP methyl ester carboxylesterase
MANYVLVHGAWGGGWGFDRLAEELFTAGHRVVVAKLKGLGLRKEELAPGITLTDHINDVISQTDAAGFQRFILAGHSYGGMVITGVAARLGARIDAIAYIDAFLPEDKQSLWDVTGQFEHDHYINTQKDTPGLVAPIMGANNPRLYFRQRLGTNAVQALSRQGAARQGVGIPRRQIGPRCDA